jgi:hypothetical protein
MGLSRLRLAGTALTLSALALTCAQTARAQTTDDNTIKACYNVSNGQMRQVAGPSDCKNGETFILWNVQGPKGDKGDKGDPGPVGPQGPQGLKGDTGATGAQGPQGPQGAQGPQGPVGPQGEKGDTGATGAQGAKGDMGATGAQGPQGEKGDKGDTGATGATGAQGPKGDKGDAGQSVTRVAIPPGDPNCPNGGVLYQSANGSDYVCTGATGPQGAQGAQGPAGPQGPTVATFPIGRAPAGGFEAITFNDNSASFICGGQYLGQATIDPTWFGPAGVDYRVVVFGERTAGGAGDDLFFDFCAGSSLGDGGGAVLHTNTVFSNSHFVDSGWKTLNGTSPVRINLRARKRSAAAGSYGHAYILVRPRQ